MVTQYRKPSSYGKIKHGICFSPTQSLEQSKCFHYPSNYLGVP